MTDVNANPPAPNPARRMLCLGGSFNPPHHGHLITARAVAESMGFEQVRLVVSAQPPHKPEDRDLASASHRVAMCRAAVQGDGLFVVDDRETRRPGPSYTFDTAVELLGEPETGPGPVHWLIGADLLAGLPRWHRAQDLVEGGVVRFVVMRRPGWAIDWEALPPLVRRLRDQVVVAPEIQIGATDLRERIRKGQRLRYLVPEPVETYITDHGLYR